MEWWDNLYLNEGKSVNTSRCALKWTYTFLAPPTGFATLVSPPLAHIRFKPSNNVCVCVARWVTKPSLVSKFTSPSRISSVVDKALHTER